MKQICLLIILLITSQVFSQASTAYEIYALEFARPLGKAPVSEIALNEKSTDSVGICFMIW
jgi:hypothetical protein